MAQTETDFFDLHKWDQGDEPAVYNAAKHNENWGAIDLALREMVFDLKYFRDLGLVPANRLVGDYATWPAHDFENVAGGPTTYLTQFNTAVKIYATGSPKLNFGWDLGALKDEVFIMLPGLMAPSQGTCMRGLFAGATVPPAEALDESIPPDAYFALIDRNNNRFCLKETDGAGSFSEIAHDQDANSVSMYNIGALMNYGVVFYLNGATNVQRIFVKIAPSSWVEIITEADATIASFRYVGVYSDGATQAYDWTFGPPLVFGA